MIADTLGGMESARNVIRGDGKFVRYSGCMASVMEHQNDCGVVGIPVVCLLPVLYASQLDKP